VIGRKHFLIAVALLFCSCSNAPRKEETIARVNGSTISLQDYLGLLETLLPKDVPVSSSESRDLKNLVLKTLVRRQVILTEAKKKEIALTEAELVAGLNRYKEGYTVDAFEQSLLEHMVDENNWKEHVRQSLLIEKLFDETKASVPAPNLEEAHKFYENSRNLFVRKSMVRALQIVVTKAELAEQLRRELKKSPGSFLKLALENSIGPEAKKDAVIEIEKDAMPEEIDRALFEGRLNEISQVIRSPYGYHIFKILVRHPALNLDFDVVKNQILQKLTQDRRKDWLSKFEEKLIRQAKIEYNRPLIQKL